MKAVILDGYTANPNDFSWDALAKICELTVYDRTAYEDIVSRVGDAEAVIINKTPIDKSIIDACPSIRYVGVLATGCNTVDTEYAAEKGIPVCNVPNYSTNSVAQLVFALILEYCCHVAAHSAAVMAGEWTKCADFSFCKYPIHELCGRTLGIIGYGAIGSRVAEIARALGMSVLVYSRSQKQGVEQVSMEELLKRSDYVTVHCPMTDETRGLFNKKTLSTMKDGAVLINTARGGIVVEKDIAEALKSGRLAAYLADVASSEPINADNPLLTAPNCFMTPHLAWASLDSRRRLISETALNLAAFIDGSLRNCVNI